MRIYSISDTNLIDADIQDIWHFFSRPENLNELTPPDMQFEILPGQNLSKMYAGMLIHYKIQPFTGIKFNWTTEITQCRDKEMFIDEQRFGPYTFWHHQHHFEQKGNQVLMTDIVHYALPLGIFGRIAHSLFVQSKLKSIFNYRRKRIE